MPQPGFTYHDENLNKGERKCWISSTIIHILILLFLLLPLFRFPIPPIGQQGILVSFGQPDQGLGDDLPTTQNEESSSENGAAKNNPQNPTPVAPKPPSEPVRVEEKVLTTEVDPEIRLKEEQKKKELEEIRKKEEELERQKKEVEAKRKAEEEARRKAAEEEARKQQEFEQKKEQFGDVFGQGKGSNDQTGNEGDPAGSPNSDILKGLSKGSGRVGGGLSDRGILFEPEIEENSQKTGRVVVKICVDRSGKVVSAKFTQRGSTTGDSDLVKVAVESVNKYLFTPSEISEQCGTVTIDFKLR